MRLARLPLGSHRRALCLTVAAAAALGSPLAVVAGETWDGGSTTSSNWSDAANWNPNGVPPNNGTANIVYSGTSDSNPNVNVPWSIESLRFGPLAGLTFTSGGQTLTIGSGGVTNDSPLNENVANPIVLAGNLPFTSNNLGTNFTGAVNTNGHTLTVTGDGDTFMSGSIFGGGGLVKNGTGILRLQGAGVSTYAQTTFANAGQMFLARTGLNAAIPGSIFIGNGIGSFASVSLDANEQISSAVGSLVWVRRTGSLFLANHSETVYDLTVSGSTVSTGSGTLTVLGQVATTAQGAVGTISGILSLGGSTRTFDIDDGSVTDDLVIDGSIRNGGVNKVGAGQLVFTGGIPNSYVGATRVNAGTLVLAKIQTIFDVNAIAGDLSIGDNSGVDVVRLATDDQITDDVTTTVFTNWNGVLDLNGFDDAIGNLTMSGGTVTTGGGVLTVRGQVTAQNQGVTPVINGNLNLAGGTRTFSVANSAFEEDLRVNAQVSNGALTKTGAGSMILAAAATNSYAGTTTVTGGTLVLDVIGGEAMSGDLTIAGGRVVLFESEQIPHGPGRLVTVGSGTLDTLGHAEQVNDLRFTSGGRIETGDGVLTVLGNVTSEAGAFASQVNGNLSLGGDTVTFNVADGAAATDLDIDAGISSGRLVKTGAGRLRLRGPGTYAGGFQLLAGTLAVGNAIAAGTGQLQLTAGTIEADSTNRFLTVATVVDGPATVTGPFQLSLLGPFAVAANQTLTKTGTGTLRIAGAQSHSTGATLVTTVGVTQLATDAGAPTSRTLTVSASGPSTLVQFDVTQHLKAVQVQDATVLVPAGADKVVVTESFTATGIGRVDLADNDMVVDYAGASPLPSIRAALVSGYAAGNWTGPGIRTSSGSANTFALGFAESAAVFTSFPAVFIGEAVDNTAVLIRYTRYGDANLDAQVNLQDVNRLASNFGVTGTGLWTQGDFNYDGNVNLQDFNRLAANFGLSAAGPEVTPENWAALAAAVPEPSATVFAPMAVPLLRRRSRRAR